jgi:hypothetical protein
MSHGSIRRRLGMVAGVATAAVLVAAPMPAPAADPPFDPVCNGRISLGEDRAEGQLNYWFACSDEVKGYALVALNREVSGFDTEPVVVDTHTGDPVTGQSFSCSGPIPGDGIGCAGLTAPPNRVLGHISVSTDPCVGDRPEVALIVSNGKGASAGPFRLSNSKPGHASRPLDGCPRQSKPRTRPAPKPKAKPKPAGRRAR